LKGGFLRCQRSKGAAGIFGDFRQNRFHMRILARC
jgi:hypothetical protein